VTNKALKKMPKEKTKRETVVLEKMAVHLTSSPRYKNGYLHLKLADMSIKVSDDDGTEIGRVEGCIGGGIELRDERSGDVYFLSVETLWTAFSEALKQKAVLA
jgi:hypothetical protein